MTDLPTWDESAAAYHAMKATELQTFIYMNEPSGAASKGSFRAGLKFVLREAAAWQTIDTAPRDGKPILGFMPGRDGYASDQRFTVMHWSGWGGGIWEDTSGNKLYGHYEPTQWCAITPPADA